MVQECVLHHVNQDRDQGPALVNTVMKTPFALKKILLHDQLMVTKKDYVT